MKNEKTFRFIHVPLNCVIGICYVFGVFAVFGCATPPKSTGDTGQLIATNSRLAQQLENQRDSLVRTIDESRTRLDDIQRTAGSILDDIDRVIYLFREYDKEVGRILNTLNQIQRSAGFDVQMGNPAGGNPGNLDSAESH